MPDNVVDQVHRMARQQRVNPGLMFGSRSHAGTANDDNENDESDNKEDEDYMPEEQEGDGSDDGYEEDANGLDVIQFPPEMDENWLRNGLLN